MVHEVQSKMNINKLIKNKIIVHNIRAWWLCHPPTRSVDEGDYGTTYHGLKSVLCSIEWKCWRRII